MKTAHPLVLAVEFSLLLAAVTLAEGQTWIPVASGQSWTCIASAADGARIVAAAQFQPIFMSTNSGTTWATLNTPSNLWTSIAASADGNTWVALTAQWQDGLIYRSTNSGTDWIPASVPGTGLGPGRALACSADGREVVAAVGFDIYRSLDSGATWSLTSAPDTNDWTSIACSADGAREVATASNFGVGHELLVPGAIYVSSDSGSTWTKVGASEGKAWVSAACSADGRTMIAAESAVYVSTNSGTNWTPVEVPLTYPCVACSADGIRLAAAGYPGLIYFSEDSGATWTASSAGSNYWGFITCSSDGTAWLALDVGHGIIWRSQTTPRPLLGIAADGGNLVLSWPVPSMSFVLQQCSGLSTTNWLNAKGKPVLNPTNLHNEVVLSPTNGSSFYRLAAP